ncbi:MAG: SRPBCC domain-containing protein [Agriterribacter sp.]
MKRTSKNTKIIQATPEHVYNAFTNPKALEYWLSPDGMTGKIHDFNLEVSGGYDMSLFYNDDKAAGKTSGNEDRYSAIFIELKPCEKIVQAIHFQSDKSEFTDEMIMEVFLKKAETTVQK